MNAPDLIAARIFTVRGFRVILDADLAKLDGALLVSKLGELERKVGAHDKTITAILAAIRELTTPPERPKRRIGFVQN